MKIFTAFQSSFLIIFLLCVQTFAQTNPSDCTDRSKFNSLSNKEKGECAILMRKQNTLPPLQKTGETFVDAARRINEEKMNTEVQSIKSQLKVVCAESESECTKYKCQLASLGQVEYVAFCADSKSLPRTEDWAQLSIWRASTEKGKSGEEALFFCLNIPRTKKLNRPNNVILYRSEANGPFSFIGSTEKFSSVPTALMSACVLSAERL